MALKEVKKSNELKSFFPRMNISCIEDEKTITFDANHEMAGKELNFEIELVEVK